MPYATPPGMMASTTLVSSPPVSVPSSCLTSSSSAVARSTLRLSPAPAGSFATLRNPSVQSLESREPSNHHQQAHSLKSHPPPQHHPRSFSHDHPSSTPRPITPTTTTLNESHPRHNLLNRSTSSIIYVAPAKMLPIESPISQDLSPQSHLPPLPPLSPSTNLILTHQQSNSLPTSFSFPLVNLSSPTPPPADRTDYFEQPPPSSSSSTHPSKPTRPLHQKAQSETSMRLQLPPNNPRPSSCHLETLPMLRKKSGEIVRSSLKLSSLATTANTPFSMNAQRSSSSSNLYSSSRSAPSTPTSGPKAVHFDAHLEHVRHFLSQQRPIAVSRDGSPIETETEGEDEYPFPDMSRHESGVRTTRRFSSHRHQVSSSRSTKLVVELVNKPQAERPGMKVCLKSVELAPDSRNLKGIVQVQNIAFEKCVAVRFTFDKWQTVSEVTAEYLSSGHGLRLASGDINGASQESIDLFGFTVKLQDVLARIEDREMEMALRYLAAGVEYWDNNSNSNYHIRFKHVRLDDRHSDHDQEQPPQQPSPVATTQSIPQQQLTKKQTSPSINRPMSRAKTLDSTTPKVNKDSCPWAVTLKAELDRLVGDDLGVSLTNTDDGVRKKSCSFSSSGGSVNPIRLDALSAINQLKAGTGLSARYDFGLSLKQAARQQHSNRSRRFESSLPVSIAPVPIEWLGVMPSGSDTTAVSGPIIKTVGEPSKANTTLVDSEESLKSSGLDSSIYRSTFSAIPTDPSSKYYSTSLGFKPWNHQPGGIVNLPPSPPQESQPSLVDPIAADQSQTEIKNLADLPSLQPSSKPIIASAVTNGGDGGGPKDDPMKHPTFNDQLRHRFMTSPLPNHHHHPCPSGLVTPQSPSLTDEST